MRCVFFTDVNRGWVVGSTLGSAVILKTTNGGQNWVAQATGNWLECVTFIDLNIGWAVGDGRTIIKTTDGGQNWLNQVSGTSKLLKSATFINANIGWVVGVDGTILRTTDGGQNWGIQQTGIINHLNGVTFKDANIGWGVGVTGSIIKTTNGGVTFVEENEKTSLPIYLSLSQNYPNPFNPVTTIAYQIPKEGLVNLKIYDFLGKEIAILVNEVKNSGKYAVKFDASNIASGIYYYRLQSGSYFDTKKMILLK